MERIDFCAMKARPVPRNVKNNNGSVAIAFYGCSIYLVFMAYDYYDYIFSALKDSAQIFQTAKCFFCYFLLNCFLSIDCCMLPKLPSVLFLQSRQQAYI
jgi:hypothetical protein